MARKQAISASYHAVANEKMLPPGPGRLRDGRGNRRRRFRTDRGARSDAYWLQGHGLRSLLGSPGGMLTAGVPVFRLPRELVRQEIEAILSLGVEIKCNMALGRDFTIAESAAGRLQGDLPRRRFAQRPQASAPGRGLCQRLRRPGFSALLQRRLPLPLGDASW